MTVNNSVKKHRNIPSVTGNTHDIYKRETAEIIQQSPSVICDRKSVKFLYSGIEFVVSALHVKQLCMRSSFDDLALFQYHYLI